VRALARPEICHYYLAELGGAPVSQLMITMECSDWRDGVYWWIQSVYVVPEQRRHGVFRRLYEHVVDAAHADGEVRGLRLYVLGDNARARATYAAVGMRQTRYQVYEQLF